LDHDAHDLVRGHFPRYLGFVPTIRAIDLFCGAGGSSWGARLAGVEVVAGFDVDIAAQRAFSRNFPDARVFGSRLENIDPVSAKRRVGRVDLLLASPECTSHSVAKGAGARSSQSRNTAFQVTRFAEVFKPRWLVVENVVSMRSWSSYERFVHTLEDLGYFINEQTLNAADFGVPQQRRRLFLVCDRLSQPANVKATYASHIPVSRAIDANGTYSYSPLRSASRASDTLARANRAIDAVGPRTPFLLVYYGSDGAGGWQRLSKPLRTITTLDRFALVKPSGAGHSMRMLQVPELKRAMGMPQRFFVGDGNRRDRIRLIGNAVCPPVMRAIVRSLLKNQCSG
jgi:DNA (cytosine-5)-methyltransferase 1